MIRVGYGPLRDGTDRWEAFLTHPTNPSVDIIAHEPSGEAVCVAFVDVYNAAVGTTHTAEDFEFYRRAVVDAEIFQVPAGFEVVAYPGDRPAIRVTAATREEVEVLFISTWNSIMGTDFEPFEFRFIPNTRALQA